MPTIDFDCPNCSHRKDQLFVAGPSVRCPNCTKTYPWSRTLSEAQPRPSFASPDSVLDDLEEHVRQLECCTHKLEQTFDEECRTVLEEPVRFSLTNLRSKVNLLERHKEESDERLHLLASECAKMHRVDDAEDYTLPMSGFSGSVDSRDLDSLARELEEERRTSHELKEKLRSVVQAQLRAEAKQDQFEVIQTENQELRSQVTDQRAELKQAQAETGKVQISLRRLQTSLRGLEKEKSTLQTELQHTRDQRSFLEAKVEGLDGRIEHTKVLSKELDQARSELDRLHQNVKTLNATISVLRTAGTKRNREHAEFAEDFAVLKEQHEQTLADLRHARKQVVELKKRQLQTETAVKNAAREHLRADELNLVNQGLQTQLNEAKRTILDAAKLVSKVDDLRRRLHQLGTEYANSVEEGGRLRQQNLEVRGELGTLIEAVEKQYVRTNPEETSGQLINQEELMEAVQTIRNSLRHEFLLSNGKI